MFPFRTIGLLAALLFFEDLLHLADYPLYLPGRLFKCALGFQIAIIRQSPCPMPSLGPSQPETLASPRPPMFIPRGDSRVCTAWLRCLVRIAHSGLREGKHGASGGNYRAFIAKATRVGPC